VLEINIEMWEEIGLKTSLLAKSNNLSYSSVVFSEDRLFLKGLAILKFG